MKIIFLSIIGALLLLWGAIFAILKWIDPIENKHFLALGGYVSAVTAILIAIVLQTSFTGQDASLKSTQERFKEEFSAIQTKFSQQTAKLLGQLEEKAELTGSEVEVRGKLRAEIDQHNRTAAELVQAHTEIKAINGELKRENNAHLAYVDSLNTERELHRNTRSNLTGEKSDHQKTQRTLQNTRRDLNKARERIDVQNKQVSRLQKDLERAQANARKALANADASGKQVSEQQEDLNLIQASIDSIYQKVLKRPRVPPPPGEKN